MNNLTPTTPPAPNTPIAILVSQAEARVLLGGISRTALWEACNRNDFDRVSIGRRTFITRASIDRHIAAQLATGRR